MFDPDAQKARVDDVDDAVVGYGHLTLSAVVHKAPGHLFGVQDQLCFGTKKHFGACCSALAPFQRGHLPA